MLPNAAASRRPLRPRAAVLAGRQLGGCSVVCPKRIWPQPPAETRVQASPCMCVALSLVGRGLLAPVPTTPLVCVCHVSLCVQSRLRLEGMRLCLPAAVHMSTGHVPGGRKAAPPHSPVTVLSWPSSLRSHGDGVKVCWLIPALGGVHIHRPPSPKRQRFHRGT